MKLPIRISTSPPSFGDVAPGEASYYCDLIETDDWQAFAVVHEIDGETRDMLRRPGTIGYLVRIHGDREIGLLFCHEDGEEWIMYRAVDHLGHVSLEPAANEALWRCANAAAELPFGHRLALSAEPRAGTVSSAS